MDIIMHVDFDTEVTPYDQFALRNVIRSMIESHTKQLTDQSYRFLVRSYQGGATINKVYFQPGQCYRVIAYVGDKPLAYYVAGRDEDGWQAQSVTPISNMGHKKSAPPKPSKRLVTTRRPSFR